MGNSCRLSVFVGYKAFVSLGSHRPRGFTLAELMLATAILLVAILSLLTLLINCMFLNESNNNLATAANDAQFVLEQIKGLPYANITSGYSPPNFTISNQTVTPGITTSDITADLKEVKVDVNWTERQRSRSFSLSTRIAR